MAKEIFMNVKTHEKKEMVMHKQRVLFVCTATNIFMQHDVTTLISNINIYGEQIKLFMD